MSEANTASNGSIWNRSLPILLTILLAASFTGYFVGLRETRKATQVAEPDWQQPGNSEQETTKSSVPRVVSYAKLPKTNLGPNRDWHGRTASLKFPMNPPPKKPADDAAILAALKQRAEIRAFDGAPPAIPHPITQMSSTSCMVCHERGALVNGKTARKMSHPFYASCTQCHVDISGKESGTLMVKNAFTGLKSVRKGQCAFPGAPPEIPHPTFMRNDCLSCHGPTGMAALQSTLPQQRACFQCHVQSNSLEQPSFFTKMREKP